MSCSIHIFQEWSSVRHQPFSSTWCRTTDSCLLHHLLSIPPATSLYWAFQLCSIPPYLRRCSFGGNLIQADSERPSQSCLRIVFDGATVCSWAFSRALILVFYVSVRVPCSLFSFVFIRLSFLKKKNPKNCMHTSPPFFPSLAPSPLSLSHKRTIYALLRV